jgi:nicotinate phosphoribosyltransferase
MDAARSLLLTDLYQLTMLQGYFEQGMHETAVFEFFARDLPEGRGFYLAAGLEQLVEFLEQARFTEDEIQWLHDSARFSQEFVDWLRDWRFTGDLDAMPEGTVFFPNEPIARIAAPMPEAQLVESRLINILHFQTLIASKAVRCVMAAPGKLLVDFGMRRAHGAEAGLFAARASYLAGFAGTATVLADKHYGVPSFGTMAHSFVQAHDRELDAFEHFALAQPNNVVLLIDTYDTETAAEKLVALAPRLEARGIAIKAVRLDSGDLNAHARKVRAILDRAGLQDTGIFSSGSLDEHELRRLLDLGAPIDGFGIGTRLDTSADAPYLDCAYKLQEYAGRARRKRSEGKATWPGPKQVYRQFDADGIMARDLLTVHDDRQAGEPLIKPCMRNGSRVCRPDSLEVIRERVQTQVAALPKPVRSLDAPEHYWVEVCEALQALAAEVDRQPH